MFDNNDGITYGSCMDVCIECKKEKKKVKPGHLEYQEVFKLSNGGNPICYCMDHFKKMLGKYMLVDPNFFEEETNDEENSLTNGSSNCDIIKKETVDESDEQIKKESIRKKTTTKKDKENDSKATK